jgi:VIT1/CCC1 family predicted Fe2+/Mn2+ transporter
VVIPFIFVHNTLRAMRISNAIAIMMLFLCGYRLGHYGGHRPWHMGFAMVVVGSVLVAITIALGG